jgi:hypothetical protein
MADIKMINNYNIKDETARNEIEAIRAQIPDVSNFATKDELGDINAILDSINGEEI